MSIARRETTWDDLANPFKVLGHPNRLQLLSTLEEPRPISRIDLRPCSETERDRSLTRQGVRHHLKKLEEQGLVRVAPSTNGSTTRYTYETDVSGIFRVCEALGDLASQGPQRLHQGAGPASGRPGDEETHAGPRLELVHGVNIGRTFPLTRGTEGERGWIIGSDPETEIDLPYDPFADPKHAEVARESDGFRLIDLRVSTQGTWLNWERMDVGSEAELQTGDVLGIGRSLMVFRT